MNLFINTSILILIQFLLNLTECATLVKKNKPYQNFIKSNFKVSNVTNEKSNSGNDKAIYKPEKSASNAKDTFIKENTVFANKHTNEDVRADNFTHKSMKILTKSDTEANTLGEIYGNVPECQSAVPKDPRSGCCGITTLDSDRDYEYEAMMLRSLGGEDTLREQYPWLVSLQYKTNDNDSEIICSASLISNQFVITAAHCVRGLEDGAHVTAVRLGTVTRVSEVSDCMNVSEAESVCSDGAFTIAVDKIIVHPQYNESDLRNDIALIKLKKLAPFNDFIRPICLPSSDITLNPPANLKLDFIGWGAAGQYYSFRRDEFVDILVDERLHIELPYRSLKDCRRIYSTIDGGYYVTDKHICAGGEKGRGACRGDSGGPLMLWRGVTAEIVGVNSYGHVKPCGQQGVPGVFTKVYRYLDWIRYVIRAI